jgi:catechol 2,3-dioxygenase-like lactoylglutathione lyase family enzyme
MTIKRLDHVSVVVDDLAAATSFFTALGMTLEGQMPIEGPWVDRVNGLEGVHVDIVMMRTPDGHGRLELTKFRNPKAGRRRAGDRPTERAGPPERHVHG